MEDTSETTGKGFLKKMTEEPALSAQMHRQMWSWFFFTFSVVVMVVSVVWLCISLRWDLNIDAETSPRNWFQRAGAVLVFSATLVEWRASQLSWGTDSIGGIFQIHTALRRPISAIQFLGFILLLLGTLIWAYGDIWVCLYKSL